MNEVGGALMVIATVLCAVFVPGGFHHRYFRSVLPPVCAHHCGRDCDLADRVADAVARNARAYGAAAHSRGAHDRWWDACRSTVSSACSTPGFDALWPRLWLARGADRTLRRHHAWALCGRPSLRPQRIPQNTRGIHPADRSRLFLIVVMQFPPGRAALRLGPMPSTARAGTS